MNRRRTAFTLLLAVCFATSGRAEDAPNFKDLVGAKVAVPKPAPASTFQRAVEDGHRVSPEAIQRAEELRQGVSTAPPVIEPGTVTMAITPEQARNFVRDFLAAAQNSVPEDELDLYSDSVDYFSRGQVQKRDLVRDHLRHHRRWPSRAFTLLSEPQVLSINGNQAVVRYRLQYQLGDGNRVMQGETVNTMVIEQTDQGRRIVAIK